jgi:hypothetical protein
VLLELIPYRYQSAALAISRSPILPLSLCATPVLPVNTNSTLKKLPYCVHMYVNGKMIPVETIPRMRKGQIKENDGGGEFKYDIFDIL